MIAFNLVLAIFAVAALAAVAGVGFFAGGTEQQEPVAIDQLPREPDRELEAA